jgi:hypothetical protein
MISRFPLRRPGYTAVQLLVVLAILLLLLGLLAPAVQRVREAAQRAESTNNLKQLALSVHNANDAFGMMPPIAGEFQNKTGSLHFFLLPFVEQQNLYNQAQTGVWDNEVWGQVINVLLDPRDGSAPPGNRFEGWLATTSYAGNWMVFGDGKATARIPNSIPDGTSNTMMYATRYQMCNGVPTAWGYPSLYLWAPQVAFYGVRVPQHAPAQADCDPERPQAINNSMIIAMFDSSVRTINPLVSAATWANVCDPADGNALGNDLD